MWQFRPGIIAGRAAFDPQPAGGSYSAEAQEFFDRITDPGTTRKDLYAAVIDGLVTDSVWTKLDALWILAADIAGNAIVNLKSSSFTLSPQNSPTFTTDRGYAGNGSSSYLNTQYNPTTASGNFTQNSASIGAWSRTNSAANATDIGILNSGGAVGAILQARWSDDTLYTCANATNGGGANTDSTGFFDWSRNGSNTSFKTHHNGSVFDTRSTTSTTVENGNLYIGALDFLGTGAIQFSTRQYAAAFIGGGLSDTDASNLYTRLQTYMTAVGA